MLKLTKRNKSYYARLQCDGVDKRKSLKTSNAQVAKHRLDSLNAIVWQRGGTVDAAIDLLEEERRERLQIPTVGEIIPDVIAAKKNRNRASTVEITEMMANKHLKPLANIRIDRLDKGKVLRWQNDMLNNEISPGTVNRVTSFLRQLFSYAMEAGYISIVFKIPKLREIRPTIRVLSDDEVNRILKVSSDTGGRIAVFVRLGLLAGLRRSEIINLRAQDIDKQHKQIIICKHHDDGFIPKSANERRIPIHEQLWPWVDIPSGRFFPVGEPVVYQMYSEWKKLLSKCDITWNCTPHTLRHTFATWLARSGVSVPQIQALLGHSSSQTSEIYMHLAGVPELRSAVGSLNLPGGW